MISQELQNGQALLSAYRQRDRVASVPIAPASADWLAGWLPTGRPSSPKAAVAVPTSTSCTSTSSVSASLFHFPEIGIEAMRAGMAAHYQLWLACRLLDADGRGWLDVDAVKTAVTQDGALFLYKAARLRALILEGNGRFWRCGDGRLWLRRPSQVAADLQMGRLTGRPVQMTAARLVQKAGYFRAELFADWLTRSKERTRPLSQAVIERLTGILPRTQRRYARRARVTVSQNIVIGEAYSDAAYRQATHTQNGVFIFTDFNGRQGDKFGRYVAWHLPASYERDVTHGTAASKRNCNKRLTVLSHEEAGNGKSGRLFFENGAAAYTAITDREALVHMPPSLNEMVDAVRPVYWSAGTAKTGTGLWHVIQPEIQA